MTKQILILSLSIYSVNLFCQATLQGVYLDERDTLRFYDDSVSFSIMSNGGLIYPMEGKGKYQLTENILMVRTTNNPHKPNKDPETKKLGDREYLESKTLVFKVNSLTENEMSLSLIGLIGNAEFKGKKSVRRFVRNHRRLKFRERQLKRKN